MRDNISTIQKVRGASQTLSGTTANASAAFDMRGFNAATIFVETLAVTDAGTAAGVTVKLQHSDTLVGTDFVDCVAGDVLGGPTVAILLDTDDNKTIGALGYVGIKRYVRAVFTGTTLTDAIVYVEAVMGRPNVAPTTTIGATVATT